MFRDREKCINLVVAHKLVDGRIEIVHRYKIVFDREMTEHLTELLFTKFDLCRVHRCVFLVHIHDMQFRVKQFEHGIDERRRGSFFHVLEIAGKPNIVDAFEIRKKMNLLF